MGLPALVCGEREKEEKVVTIKEIAALTGVSPTTVANVIHGRRGKMSDETWDKVKKALEDCRYSAHMGGKLIGNSGSGLISVLRRNRECGRGKAQASRILYDVIYFGGL